MAIVFTLFYSSLAVIIVLFILYGLEKFTGKSLFARIDPYLRAVVRFGSYWTLRMWVGGKYFLAHTIFHLSKDTLSTMRGQSTLLLERLKGSSGSVDTLYVQPTSVFLKQISGEIDNGQEKHV